jgi:murein DD-endopeptidase MepM/ murein hydrolase activator NlpD
LIELPKGMIKSIVFCLNLIVFQGDSTYVNFEDFSHVLVGYKQLLVDIRENKSTPDQSREKFQKMMFILKKAFPHANYDSACVELVFPLRGFDYRAVGGAGSGYRSKGFNLFDNSKKASHPAHDIFIKDRNQDCMDDRSGEYVEVLSVSNGLVIATENDWQIGSEYRGGNYVWVYDFDSNGLWYYAHQREIYVKTGDYVKAGQRIAQVGRTGYNAAMPRSDTHLHLTYLRIDEDGNPNPINTYGWLKNSQTFLNPRIMIDLKPIQRTNSFKGSE